jgi:hypothetical protein
MEVTQVITQGVMGFEDPPGIAGDGNPSGGHHPANGVMTYYPQSDYGSWFETCTVPDSQRALCTAVLNSFVSSYGQK